MVTWRTPVTGPTSSKRRLLPTHANARVAVSGDQLLVIPGLAGVVTFDVAPGDDTTVAELQLHARFAVRVRVNSAESIDPAVQALPQ